MNCDKVKKKNTSVLERQRQVAGDDEALGAKGT